MKKISAFSLIELSIVILIIGILIAGVTQGSSLILQSKLTSAAELTKNSSISSMPNLTLWLETTLDNSVTSASRNDSPDNNDAISAWNDLSLQITLDKKVAVSQSTDAKRPTYISNGIGGLPSLYFDGTNDFLRTESGGNTTIGAGDDTYTIIAVWKYDSSATGVNRCILSIGGAVAANSQIAELYISSGNAAGFVGSGNNYMPITIIKGAPYISIVRANHTLSSGNVSLFYNTNAASTGTTNNPANLNLNNSFFEIGALENGAWDRFHGLISEIIIFDRNLKNSEIVGVNEYLSKKYQIKLN